MGAAAALAFELLQHLKNEKIPFLGWAYFLVGSRESMRTFCLSRSDISFCSLLLRRDDMR